MKKNDLHSKTPRREFLGSLAAGAATLGISTLAPLGLSATPESMALAGEADAWFEKVKGKHRIVFDVPEPHEVFPFAWPRVFLMTNINTGTPENENGVVVVFRHNAIPFAMSDTVWAKYKFGEVFKINDPVTKAPSIRNAFWKPKPGDFAVPGIGNVAIGINELQESGVMFCVCDMALTVYSAALAAGGDAAAVKKDFVANLLPGIQVVPSGVWALGRAQEKKCGYIFAG
jgi:intracellular sulfur oxidation DsrE/DsrF family protein